ncbi:MAG: beta-lactamase family protein [Acidobacteria bacterium]|nr:beta-lactamase family protein [Acidobacteriota bacterium]
MGANSDMSLYPAGKRWFIAAAVLTVAFCVFCECSVCQTVAGGKASSTSATPTQDLPSAKRLNGWLAAYNSGDRTELQNFYSKYFPRREAMLDEELQRRRNMTGGFDFKKLAACEATHCSAILKMRDLEQYVQLEVAVSPSEPHTIEQLEIQPIPRPAEFPSPRLSESEAIAELRKKLQSQASADEFSGAVLVARHGRPIFREAYGFADRDRKIANTPETRFRLGSMNKIFTAVAVLQLVQAGKIGLDDAVGKFIRDYPNQEVATKVKIKHLLTHTGGTGDIFGPEYDAHRNELRTLADYVKLYGNRGLDFEPGTNRAYSNYGFLLLGRIIEEVSGKSYDDYVQEHIFAPAGMTRTGAEPEDTAVPDRAIAYTKPGPNASWTPNTDSLPYRGTSAGGGYSTVDDLMHFANALTSNQLLNAKSLDLLINGEPMTPGGRSLPFGSGGRNWDGVKYFGHNGGFPGMNTDMEISPQSGYTIIVLSNFDPPAAQRISEFIGSRLPERAASEGVGN